MSNNYLNYFNFVSVFFKIYKKIKTHIKNNKLRHKQINIKTYKELFLNKIYFIKLFSWNYKILNYKLTYFNNKNLKYKNNFKYLNYFKFKGLINFYQFFSLFLISILFLFLILYYSIIIKLLPFNKIMLAWICILMFLYWLISGFVFFFKKYQFGKYTSVIQRFWKRSYILFWLIEGGTFLVFLFFTFNASQESFYMFDQISIFKTHLYSWKLFFLKLYPSLFLIISLFLLLISIRYNLFSKYSIILLFLTFFLTNIVWLEFYQFYHVINFYSNLVWSYDSDEYFWFLEQEPRRTRMVNNYVMLLFILKFWHIVFIFGFWIFFVLRCNETKRIRYSLLSANYQNFVILYIFVWVFMYPWFKFFLKNLLESPYYWFYINNRKLFFRILLTDFKLYFYGLYNFNVLNLFKFKIFDFYYFSLNNQTNFESFKKNMITNKIINTFYSNYVFNKQ